MPAPEPESFLGRFLELAVATDDIRRSFDFYASLGLTPVPTSDIVPHPYGAFTGGDLIMGLHEAPRPVSCLTFVRPDVARIAAALEARDIALDPRGLGADTFHEIGFDDPGGNACRVIEARTFPPPPRARAGICGSFDALSLPAADRDAVIEFWLAVGFTATDDDADEADLRLSLGALRLALHEPQVSPAALLVFRSDNLKATQAALDERGVPAAGRLRRGIPGPHVLVTAPEGTKLLIL